MSTIYCRAFYIMPSYIKKAYYEHIMAAYSCKFVSKINNFDCPSIIVVNQCFTALRYTQLIWPFVAKNGKSAVELLSLIELLGPGTVVFILYITVIYIWKLVKIKVTLNMQEVKKCNLFMKSLLRRYIRYFLRDFQENLGKISINK